MQIIKKMYIKLLNFIFFIFFFRLMNASKENLYLISNILYIKIKWGKLIKYVY